MFEQLSQVLNARGWVVERGEQRERELVRTLSGAPVECVDGRPAVGYFTKKLFQGPKIQGGAAGVAALIARQENANAVTADHVRRACALIEQTGFRAGVHDMSNDHLHCGRIAKGRSGQLLDPTWEVDPDEVTNIVRANGGEHITLGGNHRESRVGINFRSYTTRIPDATDEAFHLDAWYVTILGLDLMMTLTDAADTVEAISNVRHAVVWE